MKEWYVGKRVMTPYGPGVLTPVKLDFVRGKTDVLLDAPFKVTINGIEYESNTIRINSEDIKDLDE